MRWLWLGLLWRNSRNRWANGNIPGKGGLSNLVEVLLCVTFCCRGSDVDYFELKATETLWAQEKLLPSPNPRPNRHPNYLEDLKLGPGP